MFLKRLFGRKDDPAELLYRAIVAAARQPHFYLDMKVPDTVNGRFDMIVLHLFLVLERLKQQGPAAEDMAQRLTDAFFRDMDRSLREMGVGDLSVGKKVRKMAEACYGRLAAYAKALSEPGNALEDAIARNVYAGEDSAMASKLADWTRAAHAILLVQDEAALLAGKVSFS